MTIYLRNFLSPVERVLLEQDQEMIILQMRQKLFESLDPEIRAHVETVTGVRIHELYYDWNLHNKSGMIMGISSEPFPMDESPQEEYTGKQQVDYEVIRISQQAQKIPEEIYSCLINPRTLIVIRNGILVRIEKELIRHGQGDLLKRIKRNLEKSYLHNSSHFESVLQKRVIDIFVDWDFELDKSMITFILNPKPLLGENDLSTVDRSL